MSIAFFQQSLKKRKGRQGNPRIYTWGGIDANAMRNYQWKLSGWILLGFLMGMLFAIFVPIQDADAQVIRGQATNGTFPFVQTDNDGNLKVLTESGDTLLVWEPKLTIAANDTTTATTSLDSVVFDPVLVQALITAVDDVDVWVNASTGNPFNITSYGVLEYNTSRYSISKIYFRTRTGTSLVTIAGSTE